MKSKIFFAVLTFFIATNTQAATVCKVRVESQIMIYDFSKPVPAHSISNEIQQILQDEKGFTIVPNQISKECTMTIDDPCKGPPQTKEINTSEENTDYQYKLVMNQDVVVQYPLWWDPEGQTETLANEDISIRIDSTYQFVDSKGTVIQYNGQPLQANHSIEGNKAEFSQIQSQSDSQRIGFVENLPSCSNL